MNKIDGIIIDGEVYVPDPAYGHCHYCHLKHFCADFEDGESLCENLAMTNVESCGFRRSKELTDKLNKE